MFESRKHHLLTRLLYLAREKDLVQDRVDLEHHISISYSKFHGINLKLRSKLYSTTASHAPCRN